MPAQMVKPDKCFKNILNYLVQDIKAIADYRYQQALGRLEQDLAGGHISVKYSIRPLIDNIPQEHRLLLRGNRR
jgi:hypothetical protein